MKPKRKKKEHRMYCGHSGMYCLVLHYDENGNRIQCPDITECEACKEEREQNKQIEKLVEEIFTDQWFASMRGYSNKGRARITKEMTKAKQIGVESEAKNMRKTLTQILKNSEDYEEAVQAITTLITLEDSPTQHK